MKLSACSCVIAAVSLARSNYMTVLPDIASVRVCMFRRGTGRPCLGKTLRRFGFCGVRSRSRRESTHCGDMGGSKRGLKNTAAPRSIMHARHDDAAKKCALLVPVRYEGSHRIVAAVSAIHLDLQESHLFHTHLTTWDSSTECLVSGSRKRRRLHQQLLT